MTAPFSFESVNERVSGVSVSYLSLGDCDSRQYVENLQIFGFSVSVHQSLIDFLSAASGGMSALFVVQAPAVNIHSAVAQLRRAFRQAGIVALSEFPDRLSRVASLMSGADSCVDFEPDSWELMATLLACQRRIQGVLSSAPKGPQISRTAGLKSVRNTAMLQSKCSWRLDDNGWSMVAPNGIKLQMSRNERDLMKFFFDHLRQPVSKSALMESIGAEGCGLECDLDVIIAKLRRKASQLALRLPIHRIRDTGYVFAVDEIL